MSIVLKGQKKLEAHFKKMNNPEKLFDDVFKKEARQSLRRLVIETNKMTGNTARGWINPLKLALSRYVVSNSIKTADKKHSIVNILNKGRKAVTPKSGKRLYIPLTNKGRSKPLGGKIPKDLEFGVDYVLAKRAKAFRGTKFIDKEEKKAGINLTKKIIKKIRKV